MCGITGALNFSNIIVDSRSLHVMTDSLYHRGPDSFGVWSSDDQRVHLGQRRLAIIDLSPRGRQPMQYRERGLVITFNGEIYNYRELRADLEKLGHRFLSNSDTEVLLHAYAEYGDAFVDSLNGMWALAIWDSNKKVLFLSRDRVGIKPLYLYRDDKVFLFASEVKAIIASGIYQCDLDLEGLNEYFTFQNIISNRTLFKDIAMLEAGHSLVVPIDGSRVSKTRYWDMKYQPDPTLKEEDLADDLLARFGRAMNRHLLSDVEVGATISGGMDSSAIVAIARNYISNLNTFTGYFDTSTVDTNDRSVSEKDDARLIANSFGTRHHERLISHQDVIDTLPSIVWHLEDPKVGMCYTFYTMAQLVSQYVTVNLSGTGGDELFAGYPWRYSLVENMLDQGQFDDAYFTWWCRLVPPEKKKILFTPEVTAAIDEASPRAAYDSIMSRADGFSPINRALYFDLKTFLHGFLMVEDKMGMAYSIETRFPFLDLELLDLLSIVPDNLKYKDGVSKYILKKAFGPLLPEEILFKRKQGFTPPDRTWYNRELNGYIHALLLGKRSVSHQYIARKEIENVLSRHERGEDMRLLIWSLMFFEGWCRTFLADTTSNIEVKF